MAINCEALRAIIRDCSNALGGIDQRIYINSSKNVDYENLNVTSGEIDSLDLKLGELGFQVIEFRKNLATLGEEYANDPNGAVLFDQTLVIPIHGRDAEKSLKISIMASGQRELDIIIPQNDGGYVYLRQAVLSSVGDGTGATKKEGSKYTLTFTAESEELAYFIDKNLIDPMLGINNLPIINSITPITEEVGKTITINGDHLFGTISVMFGIIEGDNLNIIDDNTIEIDVPSMSIGATDIKIITKQGESDTESFVVI